MSASMSVRLADGVTIPPAAEAGRHVLKSPAGDKYVEVSAGAIRLLSLFDRERDLGEVAGLAYERYGLRVSLARLDELARMLARNGIVVVDGAPPGSEAAAPAGWGFYSPAVSVDCLVEFLFRHRRVLLNPVVLLAMCLLAAYGLVNLALGPPAIDASQLSSLVRSGAGYRALLFLLPAIGIACGIHELFHAYMLKRLGVSTKGIGVCLLFGCLPCFYTDTNGLYLVQGKYRRAAVAAAGPLADFALLGSACMALLIVDDPSYRQFLAMLASSLYVIALLNINPFFFRTDAYWMLSDWLGETNLRRSSLRSLANATRRILRFVPGRATPAAPEVRWGLAAYAALGMLVTAGVVAIVSWTMLGLLARQILVVQKLGVI